ncbi:helix-turn-helix transcriptional regulator [Leifsonia kafniensis]|uniref:helix-turn-helix transcriptional regulator n=1 Tax=Leifsonia kafniensis TaxID=475957 RepID=UPI0031E8A05E
MAVGTDDLHELVRALGEREEVLDIAAGVLQARPVDALRNWLEHDDSSGIHALDDFCLGEFDAAPEQERAAWRLLAVFPARFSPEQAEYVLEAAGIGNADDLLRSLVANGILERIGLGVGFGLRVRPLYRRPAIRSLRGDDRASRDARHGIRGWWLATARSFGSTWFGAEELLLFAALDRELATLESLVKTSSGEDADELLEILARLWPLWTARGRSQQAREWIGRILASSANIDDENSFAALWAIAWLSLHLFDIGMARQAVAHASEIPGADPARLALLQQSIALETMEDPHHARILLDDALAAPVLPVGQPAEEFLRLAYLAQLAHIAMDDGAARDYCERAIALCDSQGELWFKSSILWTFAISLWRSGDRDRGYVVACEGAVEAARVEDWRSCALCLEVVAWYEAWRGDPTTAVRMLGSIDAVRTSTGVDAIFWGMQDFHDEVVAELERRLGAPAYWREFHRGRREPIGHYVHVINRDEPNAGDTASQARLLATLTDRQSEVAGLVARGKANKEIALALHVSISTVETHISHIFEKLNCGSRAQVAVVVAAGNARR